MNKKLLLLLDSVNIKRYSFIGLLSSGRVRKYSVIIFLMLSVFTFHNVQAQLFDNNGCVGGNFGIDAGLYSGVIEFGNGTPAVGTTDWFVNGSGRGVIDESQTTTLTSLLMAGGNPRYETRMNSGLSSVVDGQILIDAVWARDRFGGTQYYDFSSFETASKNGEDPAIWDIGQSNVLGKNDLIDVGGHMFRDGVGLTSELWFVGLINRAEPGGSAYMDFEFFVEDITVNAAPVPSDAGEGVFDSGGPQLGHTAFKFDASGNITSVGDFIFNVSLEAGTTAAVELRLWVSYADYTTITPATGFTWGLEYDGAFNGSPFGYASIIPLSNEACGIVNLENQNPGTAPWGTLGTKTNTYGTTYIDYSVVEVGINMTAFGLDHSSLSGADPCEFPLNTFIVKTRASNSFTAQLKDFAGPYSWGQPTNEAVIAGNPLIACDNPTVEITVSPLRDDIGYSWTTIDGNIVSDPSLSTITVDKPGTYQLNSVLPTGCPIDVSYQVVGFDPNKPFFNEPTAITSVACNGNDGSIDLTVTGGTPAYSYQWYNETDGATVISTVEDPSGLAPGNYYVVITDQIPCNITSDTFTVGARTPTTITETLTPVDCFGNKTGAIDATITGNDPYTYSWSNGATSEDIAGLRPGDYTLTATDVDGCETEKTFTITQPDAIALSVVSTDETDHTLDDGTINLTIVGGTPNYTFLWSNGATTEDISNLAAGTYTVTVTDANGCTETISATILEPEICFDGIDNDGDGLTDCFDPDCTVSPPGTITPSNNPVCVGDTGVTYTIVTTGADSYTWTVPAGATITAGQGTVQITVDWVSNIGGQICVTATIDGCESATASCFTVQLDDVPPAPGTIIIQN